MLLLILFRGKLIDFLVATILIFHFGLFNITVIIDDQVLLVLLVECVVVPDASWLHLQAHVMLIVNICGDGRLRFLCVHAQYGSGGPEHIRRRRIHIHTLIIIGAIACPACHCKGGTNVAAWEQLSVVLATKEWALLLVLEDVTFGDALLAFSTFQLLTAWVWINVLFEVCSLIKREVTGFYGTNEGLFACMHSKVIKNVLDFFEKLAAISIVAREHGGHTICESVRALELELAE